MAAWRIANYSAFIKHAREDFGLTPMQSRALYTQMRRELDRPAFAVDLERHPRIRNRAIEKVEKEMFRAKEEAAIARELESYIDYDEPETEYEGGIDYET